MRRQMISLFTLLFVLSLLFLQGTASAESGNEGAVLSTGSCGAELSWVLELDGTLTISGTGPMDDYSFSYGKHAPWHDELWNQIRRVVVSDGVTYIGNYAFSGCSALAEVILPETLSKIGDYAFFNCRDLVSITLPQGLAEIGASAFNGCGSLAPLTIPVSVTHVGGGAFYGTATSAAGQDKVDLSNVKDLIIVDGALIVLREDGSVQTLYGDAVSLSYSETSYDRESLRAFGELKNVVQLADFSFAIAALCDDGSVDIVKTSMDASDYSDIEAWRDIVQLSGGYQLLMGLRKDGCVEVGGDDHTESYAHEMGRPSTFEMIRTWTEMTRVLAGCCAAGQYAVGLRQDGTLNFNGIYVPDEGSSPAERIVDFDCSGWGLVALREDGRIIAAGGRLVWIR